MRNFGGGNGLTCITSPSSWPAPRTAIISKLEWANLAQSRRQIEDVAAILRVRWDSLDHAYLEKWIAELGLREEWDEARHAARIVE